MALTSVAVRGRPRRLIGALAVATALLVISSCGQGADDTKLRVEDFELKLLPGGARIVTGSVHNDSDAAIAAAQVQISLFDDKNRRVDAMHAVVRDIPPRGFVEFREPVQSDLDVRGARVKSILLIGR